MSAPTIDPSSVPGDPGGGAGAVERPRGVIGMGLGLLVLVVGFVLLARPRGAVLDGAEELALLMPAGAPADFQVESAHALPTGEKVLRLVRAEGAEPVGPEELVLVRYRSNEAVTADMRGSREGSGGGPGGGSGRGGRGGMKEDPGEKLARWERTGDFAMHLTTEKGEVAWDTFRAACATERSLRDDGTWRESVRVNLSQPDRFLILYAQWPVGVAAEPDALVPILRTVHMEPIGV